MSQVIFSSINPLTTSGTQLATILNDFKDAMVSGMSGNSRPANIQANGMWVDISADPIWVLKMYDGVGDIVLLTINSTTGIASITSTDNSFEIIKTSDDDVGPLLAFQKARIAGAGQVLTDDELGQIEFKGTTDGTVEVVQARVVVYSNDDVTNTNRGSYYSLEACLAGTNTLQEWVRIIEGKVGIGVASPDEKIHANGNIKGQNISDTVNPSKLILNKNRVASLGQVLSGDGISQVESLSKDNAGASFTASNIDTIATENHTATNRGSKVTISTIDAGGTVKSEKIEISERVKPKVDVEMGLTNVHYFGDPSTDGSFRTRIVAGEMLHEKRISGVWTTYYIGVQPEVVQSEGIGFNVEYNKYHIVTAAVTATLPAPVANQKVTIKNLSGGTVTVARNGGENIDGVASDYSMVSVNESLTLVTDGTDWFIV